MNMFPIIGFYFRRKDEIAAMFHNEGALADLLRANIPIVKKHWPQYNKTGLLDDLLETVNAATAPSAYPDPNQRVRKVKLRKKRR